MASLTESCIAVSDEQDRTACMYGLILLSTRRKRNPWWQTAGSGCRDNLHNITLCILQSTSANRRKESYIDSVNQDQTAQCVQSDLGSMSSTSLVKLQ